VYIGPIFVCAAPSGFRRSRGAPVIFGQLVLSFKQRCALCVRWLIGDALLRSEMEANTAGGLSLYDLGGLFLILAVVVSILVTASVVRHCIQRRRAALDRLPGAKLVINQSVSQSFIQSINQEIYDNFYRALHLVRFLYCVLVRC